MKETTWSVSLLRSGTEADPPYVTAERAVYLTGAPLRACGAASRGGR